MTKEQLKQAADDLRAFADSLETNNPEECRKCTLFHHVPVVSPEFGDMQTDAKFMGLTWVFTSYPRAFDENKIRDVIEGRL